MQLYNYICVYIYVYKYIITQGYQLNKIVVDRA